MSKEGINRIIKKKKNNPKKQKRGKRKQNTRNKWKTNNKMVDLNPTIAVSY